MKVRQVKELSQFLETDLDGATVEKIAKHCSFANLKNVKTFDLSARLKESDNFIVFKIMRVSASSMILESTDFQIFNPNIKTVARRTENFMNSGKVGGWRSKLTIHQGRFSNITLSFIFKYVDLFILKILISQRALRKMQGRDI